MRQRFAKHWEIFTAIFGQRRLKWVGGVWVVLGVYDLALSQFIPKYLAEKWPKAYEVISMTYGWLPWWAWGWIGTALVAVAAFEYAVRLHSRMAANWPNMVSSAHDQKEVCAHSTDLLHYLYQVEALIQENISSESELLATNKLFIELKTQVIEFIKKNISLQRAYDLSHPGLSVVVWNTAAFNERHNTLLHDMNVFQTALAAIQRSQADLEAARNGTRD